MYVFVTKCIHYIYLFPIWVQFGWSSLLKLDALLPNMYRIYLWLCLYLWQELHDYGGGIPNELVVMLERCVGLSARWPGLLPDAYLTYRLYDLPPHVSQTTKCTADPVFNDATSYPLAITTDVLQYLRYASSKVFFCFCFYLILPLAAC